MTGEVGDHLHVTSELEKIPEVVEPVLRNIEAIRGTRHSGFCIGTTVKPDGSDFFLTPIRETPVVVAGSVVVSSVAAAQAFASALEGRVNYLFADVENKIIGSTGVGDSIEEPVRASLENTKFIPYKSNDLTVDAIEKMISSWLIAEGKILNGSVIAILGCGNIGAKLALRMVESGLETRLFRRNREILSSIANGINSTISPASLARAIPFDDAIEAASGADIVVGLAPGVAVVSTRVVNTMKQGGLIIDGGKGCVTSNALITAREKGFLALRADVRSAFSGFAVTALSSELLFSGGLGHRQIGEANLVGAGVLALADEVIVDHISQPQAILGIADGKGELYRELSESQNALLARVRGVLRF